MRSVQVFHEGVLVQLLRRKYALVDIFDDLLSRVNYLRPPCVGDGNVEEMLVIILRGLFNMCERAAEAVWEKVRSTENLDSDHVGVKSSVRPQLYRLTFDQLQDSLHLF